eukprot:CAMPEP_0183297324 /NCGR_PEP_ID=MMETSP0160_2-20130417/4649_1 /TAXON_ID=2839 ORGANISM="Odontella Sinensis, Strain Grunow 1884" /NCGR_SAMPLE_ID=MMETSP0160_2 /ASSEMBLY_ACC=CAM_ASM_000250 /LENGTH=138 /DNA_ID=CAMNT_0025459123 /DNA_START=410 /DNA_END=826 /DNA_ORIENTATION=-
MSKFIWVSTSRQREASVIIAWPWDSHVPFVIETYGESSGRGANSGGVGICRTEQMHLGDDLHSQGLPPQSSGELFPGRTKNKPSLFEELREQPSTTSAPTMNFGRLLSLSASAASEQERASGMVKYPLLSQVPWDTYS